MAAKSNKKVVKVEKKATKSSGSSKSTKKATWKPTAEAKSKATTFRVIAWILWILAIGAEAYLIFVELSKNEPNMTYVYFGIGVIAVLATVGNILWKQANKLDPASKSQPFKFWVQNQLGAIITILAFLPLAILIYLNKDIPAKDRNLAAGIAAAAMLLVVFTSGITYNSPSVEEQSLLIEELTGENEVAWVDGGSVYHVCEDVEDVNRESEDGQIYIGTVGAAHDAGKERLTLEVESELEVCGYEVPENIDEIVEQVRAQRDAIDAEDAADDAEEVVEDDAELEPAE